MRVWIPTVFLAINAALWFATDRRKETYFKLGYATALDRAAFELRNQTHKPGEESAVQIVMRLKREAK